MNTSLNNALSRTLLLMRDELESSVSDQMLLAALTGTQIVLSADEFNLASHGAQSAYVNAALLMARSGHRVYLDAPNVPLIGPQPPLRPGRLVTSLLEVGRDLLPGVVFLKGTPAHRVDLCARLGSSHSICETRRVISVNAAAWSAFIDPLIEPWKEPDWPFGALAAGALIAGEAFKASLLKLRHFARAPARFDEFFAFTDRVRLDVAPPGTPRTSALGLFDLVSGGAITNAVLFCMARVPGVTGSARVIDDDCGDISNLNRYALLLGSQLSNLKVDTLRSLDLGGLSVETVPTRYDETIAAGMGNFAPHVLVGVDHIPTRWAVQRVQPAWLGIGATTHWSAMASVHTPRTACAGCLHPTDELTDGPIPTVAFVSFWAGLFLAAYFVRKSAGEILRDQEQCTYFTPLRPESIWRTPVSIRHDCPVQKHIPAAAA